MTVFDAFVTAARAGLTTRWAFADETEGRWYGKEDNHACRWNGAPARTVKNSPARLGPCRRPVGRQRQAGPLLRGRSCDVAHRRVWIFDRHGGEPPARSPMQSPPPTPCRSSRPRAVCALPAALGATLIYVGVTQFFLQRRIAANARPVDAEITRSDITKSVSMDTDRSVARNIHHQLHTERRLPPFRERHGL